MIVKYSRIVNSLNPLCVIYCLMRAFFKDEGIVVTLNLENAAVAFAFAFGDGVGLVPGFEELAVLLGKLDAVGLFHVEVDAGD